MDHVQISRVCTVVIAALVGVAVGALLQPGHGADPVVPAAAVVATPVPAAAVPTVIVQLPPQVQQAVAPPVAPQRLVAPAPVKSGAVSTPKQVAPAMPKITVVAPAPVTTTVTSTPRSAPSELPPSNHELTELPSSNGSASSEVQQQSKEEVKTETKHHKSDDK